MAKHEIPQTSLAELVNAGILQRGQTLYFHLNGERIVGPRYEATVSAGRNLVWCGEDGKPQHRPMSYIAQQLNPDLGRQETKERGPLYWFTKDGKSVNKLWLEYLGKVQFSDGKYYSQAEVDEAAEI